MTINSLCILWNTLLSNFMKHCIERGYHIFLQLHLTQLSLSSIIMRFLNSSSLSLLNFLTQLSLHTQFVYMWPLCTFTKYSTPKEMSKTNGRSKYYEHSLWDQAICNPWVVPNIKHLATIHVQIIIIRDNGFILFVGSPPMIIPCVSDHIFFLFSLR